MLRTPTRLDTKSNGGAADDNESREVVILAANGLSGAHATCADTEEVDGGAARPKERSDGVNDNAKESEEGGNDASACSLSIIAAPESPGVALACGRRGWNWRVGGDGNGLSSRHGSARS